MTYDIYSRLADKWGISRDEAKKRCGGRLALGAPYGLSGPDAYLEFARKAWPDFFDTADDGPEVAIIRHERAIAQEESDVQPRE
jgi:hypothetical protein